MTNWYTQSRPTQPGTTGARPLYKQKRVWIGGILIAVLCGSCGAATADTQPKAAAAKPKPAVTVTFTPKPAPAVTVTITSTPKPVPAATVTVTAKAKPRPTVTVTKRAPAVADDSSGDSSGDSSVDSGSVYYQNCDAVRAAGAAPIRVGDPGYAAHLDRDGDGVGCE